MKINLWNLIYDKSKDILVLKYKHLMSQKRQFSQHFYLIHCNVSLEPQAFFF